MIAGVITLKYQQSLLSMDGVQTGKLNQSDGIAIPRQEDEGQVAILKKSTWSFKFVTEEV